MTLKQFNDLPQVQKIIAVEKYGELVLYKTFEKRNYYLCQLDSFYVEIVMLRIADIPYPLHAIYAFTEAAMLMDLYIADIDISQVLAKCNN